MFQECDDIVTETLVVFIEVVVALRQRLCFLVEEIFSVVQLLFYDIAGGDMRNLMLGACANRKVICDVTS